MRQHPNSWSVLRELLADADRQVQLRLFAALLAVCAGAVLAALAPLALKRMVDTLASASASASAAASGISQEILLLAAAYLAVLCTGRLLTEVRPLLVGVAEQRLLSRLSRRFFAHVLDLPAAFHLDRQAGTLQHSLSQATAASQLVVASLMQVLPAAMELITVIVVLSHLGQPVLVAIFLASAAAYTVVFRDGLRHVRRCGQEVSARAITGHARLADALLNIETIKCFDAHASTRERYGEATDALEHSWQALHQKRARLGLAVAAVFSLSVGACVFVAVAAVQQATLSIGGFVLTTVYMLQMVRPVEALGAAVRDIGQAIEFAAPAVEILRQPVERSASACPDTPALGAGRATAVDLHLSSLRLAYAAGPQVLDDLSLHVPAGTSLAIVGASGAGKSSLARLILGLVEPDAGSILFDGVCSGQLGPNAVRNLIGYVPQDVMLFDDTLALNVGIGRPGASLADIEEACRAAQLHGFIESLPNRYDTQVGPRGLKLSGGERQRIGIARAILRRPRIYLFDEPTSALDSSTEAEIVRDLRRICAGSTTIIITHRMAAARWTQRVAVLQDGRILEVGTQLELAQRQGAYARLCRLQSQRNAESSGTGDLTGGWSHRRTGRRAQRV